MAEAGSAYDLKAGDRVCCLYDDETERRQLLLDLTVDARRSCEKVLWIGGASPPIEVTHPEERRSVMTWQEMLLHGTQPDLDAAVELLKAESKSAAAEGYAGLRLLVDLGEVGRIPELAGSLGELAVRLQEWSAPQSGVVAAVLDVRQLSALQLLSVLSRYAKILAGGKVHANPFYLPNAGDARDLFPTEALRQWLRSSISEGRDEVAIGENDARYKLLFENSNDLISIHDVDGVTRYASAAVQFLLGYRNSEVIGRPFDDFVHPEDAAALRRALREVLEGQSPPLIRYRVRCRDGDYIWFESSGRGVVEKGRNHVKEILVISRDVTRHVAAEGALRRAKEFAERLIETANVMIVGLDSVGRVEIFNAAAESVTGYCKADILGRSWFETVVPSDRYPDAWKVFQEWQSSDFTQPLTREGAIVTKDGEERFVSWRNNRIEEEGRFAGTISFGMDITERRRAEQKLSLSDSILANVAAVVLVSDSLGRVTYASPSVKPILGYEPSELLGDGWWERMYPERSQREWERQFVLHSVESKFPAASEPYERVVHHKNGQPRWIAWQDTMGADGSIIGVGHDITRRKTAEEQLQKVMHAVEQSPSSVVITDIHGRIEYVNPKFTEVTGYSREEALGRNPRILKSGEMSPQEYSAMWKTLTAGREWRGEFHNRRKDGGLFWEFASISPIKNDRGEITHYVAIKEDITERKSLELQLQQSQKMQAIGTLAGGIAHDFNNLLTAINGYSELILSRLPESDPLRATLEEIHKAGKRAANLTRQLLAFSRRQIMLPRVIDLNVAISELNAMLCRLLGETIELVTELDPSLGRIKADRGQIEQVIVNLAVNARDAMPGGGRLTITTSNLEVNRIAASRLAGMQPGSYVVVAISDTGCGISPDVKPHIFEPFFTTKEVGKGTGLGLSTAYGIVKQSGGYIYCSSEVDRGTTFRVYLPRVE